MDGDRTALQRAPRGTSVDLSEMLLSLSEAINADSDLERVLQTVTDVSTALSGAQFGAFFYNAHDARGELYRFHVLSGADADAFAHMPAPRITALFEPTFTGQQTVHVRDLAKTGHTGLPPGHLPVRSYLATPVVSRVGEVIGALLFGHKDPGVFDERSVRMVRGVAAHAAVAVENARLFAAERRARREAERTTARLALLQGVTSRLAKALTVRDAADVVTGTLSTWEQVQHTGVYLREEGRLVAVSGRRDGVPIDLRRADVPEDLTNPLGRAALTREPVVVASPGELTEQFPGLSGRYFDVIESGLALPLVAGGLVHGVLALAWSRPHLLAPEEYEVAALVAGQLAQAVDRALLYEAERRARANLSGSVAALTAVSQTLQRSLLPREVPSVEGVSVAVRYLPSSPHAEVGGDWYDVVLGPDRSVTFVVGDVQGHSLAAAAVMGQLRVALRAYLSEGHEPDVAMARANRLLAELDPSVLATCCLVRMDPENGELRIARAGHPLPLLRQPEGDVVEVDATGGPPLGVVDAALWPLTTHTLLPGARVVLFTDGLVERPGTDLDCGVADLVRAVGSTAHLDYERAADAVVEAVGQRLTDDVALMICDYVGTRTSQQVAVVQLDEDLTSVALARRFTRETLRDWVLAQLEDAASLLVSEMVTNALLHTGGPAVLELRLDGDRVRVSVTDGDSRSPRPRRTNDLAATSGRGLVLVEAVSQAWGVEPHGNGKRVWADLAACPEAAARLGAVAG